MRNYEFVDVESKTADTIIGVKLSDGSVKSLPGVFPFMDENNVFTGILAVGNKNGMDKKIDMSFLRRHFSDCKFVFNGRLASYVVRNYKEIERDFDGVMAMEYNCARPKALYMVHSMMVRSMPYKGFFWNNILQDSERDYDFSILTKINDVKNKRWDRCIRIVDFLCERKLRGIIVTQESTWHNVSVFDKWHKRDYLKLSDNVKEYDFHQLHCRAHVGVFPNTLDSFPKHMIESVLADKTIIASNDLTMGKRIIDNGFGYLYDFDKRSNWEDIYQAIIDKKMHKKNNRQNYLMLHNFTELSRMWANELNRLFHTSFKRIYFLNHLKRIKENGLIQG